MNNRTFDERMRKKAQNETFTPSETAEWKLGRAMQKGAAKAPYHPAKGHWLKLCAALVTMMAAVCLLLFMQPPTDHHTNKPGPSAPENVAALANGQQSTLVPRTPLTPEPATDEARPTAPPTTNDHAPTLPPRLTPTPMPVLTPVPIGAPTASWSPRLVDRWLRPEITFTNDTPEIWLLSWECRPVSAAECIQSATTLIWLEPDISFTDTCCWLLQEEQSETVVSWSWNAYRITAPQLHWIDGAWLQPHEEGYADQQALMEDAFACGALILATGEWPKGTAGEMQLALPDSYLNAHPDTEALDYYLSTGALEWGGGEHAYAPVASSQMWPANAQPLQVTRDDDCTIRLLAGGLIERDGRGSWLLETIWPEEMSEMPEMRAFIHSNEAMACSRIADWTADGMRHILWQCEQSALSLKGNDILTVEYTFASTSVKLIYPIN